MSSPSLHFARQAISLPKAHLTSRNFNACSTQLLPAFKRQNTDIWHVKLHQNHSSDFNGAVNTLPVLHGNMIFTTQDQIWEGYLTQGVLHLNSFNQYYSAYRDKSFIAHAHCWTKNKQIEATKTPKKIDLFKLLPLFPWIPCCVRVGEYHVFQQF